MESSSFSRWHDLLLTTPFLLLFLLLSSSYQTANSFRRHPSHTSCLISCKYPALSSSSDRGGCSINDGAARKRRISGRLNMENEGGEDPQEETIEELMRRVAAEQDAERQANAQAELERKIKAKKAKDDREYESYWKRLTEKPGIDQII